MKMSFSATELNKNPILPHGNFRKVRLVLKISFIFLIYSFNIFYTFCQKKEYKFIHFNTSHGLSHSNVVSILEDNRGFMWFGTRDGLNKYDGYKFTTYKNIPGDSNSISGNIVKEIVEDYDKNIWLATNSGLNKYNKQFNTFIQYRSNPDKPGNLVSNNIETVYVDKRGTLWVGTDEGLSSLKPKSNVFELYQNSSNPKSLISNKISSIIEDSKGNLWIGTNHGLDLLDRNKKEFVHQQLPNSTSENSFIKCLFVDKEGNLWIGTKTNGLYMWDQKSRSFIYFRHNSNNTNSLGHNSILSLGEDAEGNILIGTENGGLDVYNKKMNIFNHNRSNENIAGSLINNSIHSIYKDSKNNIWVGTFSAGIAFCDWNKKKFKNYIKEPGQSNGLSHNNVKRFAEDQFGNIWIATDGGGINLFNSESQSFKYYRSERTQANSLGGNHIISLIVDKDDNIWAANYSSGISYFNRKTKTFKLYSHKPGNPNSLSANETFDVLEDRYGDIWIGTYGGGLNRLNRKTQQFTRYTHNDRDTNSLGDNKVLVLFEDSKGNLWIGTELAGLDMFDRNNNKFIHYSHKEDDSNSISYNLISNIIEDSKGFLWISTFGALNRFDPKTKKFKSYGNKDGMPSDTPKSIEEDQHGNLWIGTNQGLIKFNPNKKSYRIYTIHNGLAGDEFSFSSSLKTRIGEMYFGSNSGFCSFFPDSITDNPNIPPVFLTDFQIFNRPVTIGPESPLKEHINQTREITLSYDQQVFSFEFAALNYTSTTENQYAYKLENFDKNWNYVGKARTATYTNLDPGEYIFKVIASNNDGLWNKEGIIVKIIITPPFWLTWWFKFLVVATITTAAVTFYKIRVSIIKNQRKILSNQNSELNKINDQLQKTNVELDNYVYRASHDLRAPLTSLMGLISLCKEEQSEATKAQYLNLMEKSIHKMDTFIKNIIDYSRNARMEMQRLDIDFKHLVSEVFDELQYMEGAPSIEKRIAINKEKPFYSDPFRLKIILNNLISNSIKYVNPNTNSRIDIDIKVDAVNTIIKISDNGIGIREESVDKIFGMFYRATQNNTGSGLGLYIVKEAITVMKGTIEVKSVFGEGTTFIITLPHIQEGNTLSN